MIEPAATVFIVDNDPSARSVLARLLGASGYLTRTFGSADEFLSAGQSQPQPACLVLDIRLPGMDGFELQRKLAPRLDTLPVIFITGYGDLHACVLAMKQGAFNYLPKPFRADELLDVVAEAIDRSREGLRRCAQTARQWECLRALTPREHQVFCEIVRGRLNKQIAASLGITIRTVKVHRRHVMEKTGMRSFADLVRLADRVGL